MFGRRPDGRRVNDIDPVVKITPYVMPQRCDAQIFLKHRTDMELLASYIHKQADKGEKLGYMTILIAAYVRALSQNPCVNRFVMNKQLFARNNCTVSFNVLKDPYHIDKGELVCKTRFDLTDTIYDVRDRIEANIDALRGANAEEGFLEKLLNFGFAVPGLATFLVALIRLLDRYGLCPGALLNELPFHGSMYMTNVASIRLHEVNHHIYNFGNIGLFFSLGTAERIVVEENGTMRTKRFLPIGITADERICSGAHYAHFFTDMRRYLLHPELLEQPPEKVLFDHDLEYSEAKPKKAE